MRFFKAFSNIYCQTLYLVSKGDVCMTIKQVAEKAGVSVASVSNVVNGN